MVRHFSVHAEHAEQAWHFGETPDWCWECKWHLLSYAARKGSECMAIPNWKGGTCWWSTSHTRKLSCWERGQKQGLRMGCPGGTLPAADAGRTACPLDPPHPASHLISTSTKTESYYKFTKCNWMEWLILSTHATQQDYFAGGDCEFLNRWTSLMFHICLQQVALIKLLQKRKA